ncbi:hypothetical protein, partial [Phenylobacterium sp.]|uniref:hypothetical protein n=1 Tax=Phenylobacterium sp. TaxID=1871053 RepID=UPI0025D3BE5F
PRPRAPQPRAPAAGATADATYVLYKDQPSGSGASLFNFDYGPPTSPATSLLGLTPDKAPPATSLKSFVLAVPTLFGGQSGQSTAFDFAPAALFETRGPATFTDYVNNYATRLAYRTRLSVGALNGDNGGGDATKAVASRIAAGFSVSLLDYSDPVMTGRQGGTSFLVSCLAGVRMKAEPILSLGEKQAAITPAESDELELLNPINVALVTKGHTPTDADMARFRHTANPYIPGSEDTAPPAAAALTPQQTKAAAALQKIDAIDDPKVKAAVQAIWDALAADAKPPPPPVAPTSILTPDQFKAAILAEVTRLKAKRDTQTTTIDASTKSALDKAGVTASLSSCADQASRLATFAPNLQFGAGDVESGAPGQLDHFKTDSQVVWGAFKFPLAPTVFAAAVQGAAVDQIPQHAVLGFVSGRFGWSELVVTGNKTTPQMVADTNEAWLGLEWISAKYRLTGQYGWNDVRARLLADRTFDKSGEAYLLAGQFQLGSDKSPVWLSLSYGNGYGTATTLKAHTALVTLSYSPAKPPDLTASK